MGKKEFENAKQKLRDRRLMINIVITPFISSKVGRGVSKFPSKYSKE